MARCASLVALALACVSLVACAGEPGGPAPAAEIPSNRARAQPPAAAAAPAALSRVADSSPARRRIGYVNLERLRDVQVVGPNQVLQAVLGPGAEAVRAVGAGPRTAITVGGAIILRGGRLPDVGARSGSDGIVLRARGAFAGTLSQSRPQTNLIAPETPSAVQSCLGDATAETIIGSAVLGANSAIGAGLRPAGTGGEELAICAAPHYRRDLRRIERRLKARYPGATVGEVDIGERDIIAAKLRSGSLAHVELLELLGGGRALRTIARF